MSSAGRDRTCPDCGGRGTVISSGGIELPADDFWDEISLTLISCTACDFRGAVVGAESRGHGTLDDDTLTTEGHRLGRSSWESIHALIKRCPCPANPRCECRAHQELDAKVVWGTWGRFQGYETEGRFEIRLAGGHG